MTNEEMDELDRLIAEKLMGWKYPGNSEYKANFVPQYTRNHAAAMEVLEMLHDNCWTVYTSKTGTGWLALGKQIIMHGKDWDSIEEAEAEGRSDTLPKAICRLAEEIVKRE